MIDMLFAAAIFYYTEVLEIFQRMTRLLFLCFALLLCLPLSGQQDPYALHFDKPFYTSGEIIWFTVYPPDSSLSPLPAVLRLTLHNPAGTEVQRFHLRQSDTSLASGYIRIPYDWPSGNYRLALQCPTDARSDSGTLINTLIPVYSDLEAPRSPAESTEADRSDLQFSKEAGSLQVSVDLDRNSYQPGMMVEANLSVKDEKGSPVPASVSVSVTDHPLVGDRHLGQTTFRTSPAGQAPCPAPGSAMIFQGQVLDSTGAPRRTFSLSAYLYPLDTFLYTQTDTLGFFTLPLPDFYGEAHIQFADFLDKGIRIKKKMPAAQSPTRKLLYTQTVIDYLRLSRQRKKIYQLYGSLEMLVEPSLPDQQRMPGNPDRLIRLSDYELFPDIPTLFRELLTPLKFRKEDGRPAARMYNPESRQYYRSEPIFLIDGQLTSDAAYIAELDIDRIESIALYFDPVGLSERFGRLGLGGVVILKTTGAPVSLPSGVAPNRFTITGLQPPAVFPVANSGEQPAFRPLVFWQGNLRTDASGKARITFQHTDDLSRFRIKAAARDEEGHMGFGAGGYSAEQ